MNNADLNREVKRLVHLNRHEKGYVCPVDILIQLDYLSKKDYENWRFGQVDYLEKVCKINLRKLSLINNLIIKHSKDLGLQESWTAYNKFGKGVKQQLQFSKSGKQAIENAYSTHYIDKERIRELKENKASM